MKREYGTYIQCNISHKKEGSPAIYAKWMTLKAYAKRDKSGRERQILYDLTYVWNLKKTNHKIGEQIDIC